LAKRDAFWSKYGSLLASEEQDVLKPPSAATAVTAPKLQSSVISAPVVAATAALIIVNAAKPSAAMTTEISRPVHSNAFEVLAHTAGGVTNIKNDACSKILAYREAFWSMYESIIASDGQDQNAVGKATGSQPVEALAVDNNNRNKVDSAKNFTKTEVCVLDHTNLYCFIP